METNESNTVNLPDPELIEACQSGDRRAFEHLVKRYYQQTYSIALVQVKNREVALDISQEVFVRIYRHIKTFDTEKSFSAWLYVITRNLCRNYVQRYRHRWTVFSDVAGNPLPLVDTVSDSPSEALERNERHRQLWKAIQALSEADREIIQLKDLEDFSYKEISEVLGIPQGSVMSRLYYARKRLGEKMRAQQVEGFEI